MLKLKFVMAACLAGSLAACGGGGGSTGTSASGTPSASTAISSAGRAAGDGGGGYNTYTRLSGIAGDAQLTKVNQNDFVRLLLWSVLESDYIGYAFRAEDDTVASDRPISVADIGDQIVQLAEEAVAHKKSQARPYNSTSKCESGSLTITGELDNSTLAGVLVITFNDCAVGGVVKRGNATITINKISSDQLVDYALGYDGMTVATSSQLLLYTGSQHAVRTLTNGILTKYVVSSDLYRLDQVNNRITLDKTENTVTTSGQQVSGQLCDGPYGCVNLSTRIPFTSSEGELTMSGAFGSKIMIYVSNGRLTSRLDEGNGSYQSPVPFTY